MSARYRVAPFLLAASLGAQVSKTIDLSTSQAGTKFYVIFASRGGSATGHAFVLWGAEDDLRQRSTVKAFGVYPASDKDNCGSVYRRVPGSVVDESTNHGIAGITEELIVRVDQTYFDRSLKLVRVWECKHEFALLKNDCVEFIRAVGGSLDLEMPRRFITRWAPRAYVRALLESVDSGELVSSGARYRGTLMNGKPMGRGTLTFDNGTRIDATFWGLDRHVGSGYLYLTRSRRYEGSVVDYRPHGRGTVSRMVNIDDTETSEPLFTGQFEHGELRILLHDYTRAKYHSRSVSGIQRDIGVIDPSPSTARLR